MHNVESTSETEAAISNIAARAVTEKVDTLGIPVRPGGDQQWYMEDVGSRT